MSRYVVGDIAARDSQSSADCGHQTCVDPALRVLDRPMTPRLHELLQNGHTTSPLGGFPVIYQVRGLNLIFGWRKKLKGFGKKLMHFEEKPPDFLLQNKRVV